MHCKQYHNKADSAPTLLYTKFIAQCSQICKYLEKFLCTLLIPRCPFWGLGQSERKTNPRIHQYMPQTQALTATDRASGARKTLGKKTKKDTVS